MTDNRLSRLYRRLTAHAVPEVGALDADRLLAIARGDLSPAQREVVADALSRSDAQAALVRVLRAIEPDAAKLAAGCAACEIVAHPRRTQGVHHATHARRRRTAGWRWAVVAACLVAVLGLWSLHELGTDRDAAGVAATATARPDRIFTNQDEIFSATMGHSLASGEEAESRHHDEIFRGDFRGG